MYKESDRIIVGGIKIELASVKDIYCREIPPMSRLPGAGCLSL